MTDMNRRTFLLCSGRWLVFVGLAPLVAGCGGETTTTAETVGGPTSAGGSTSSTSAGAAAGSAVESAATSSTTGSTIGANVSTGTTSGSPDLAVVKGDVVDTNVRTALALLGGMKRYVKQGGRVVVKPNVLTGRPPQYATTTSPELITSVIKMCWEAGAKEVVVLDNPTTSARAAFEVSGLAQAVAAAGATLKYLSSRDYQSYDIPQGNVLTSWEFVTEALTADTLINLTLPKQHSVSGATMTMKNLMGIMGGRRGEIHIDFDQKIVDVNTLVKPTLAILDAYRVLLRNGPTGGSLNDVRLVKTLVAGTNPVSIDAYGAQFLDMRPTDLGWLVEANKRGLGEIDVNKLKIATANA